MPQNLREIPPIFYNSDTGGPFERCLVCDEYLLSDADYIIEKSFVHYPNTGITDLIWEFAICIDCMDSIMSEYSKESHQAINEFFLDNMNLDRQNMLAASDNFEVDEWLKECIITGKTQEQCKQFQICLHCTGELAVFDRTPFMICDEAMDTVTQLLSNSTIDAMNRFRDKHFPPPEDLSPLLRDRDFVLI